MEITTVSGLTRYLRELFESNFLLQSVWVEGEVSNLRRSTAGHCYFTLKDAEAQIKCAWFAGSMPLGARPPSDGDQVVAHGRVSIYEQRGEYQIYVTVVHPAGAGLLNLRFEELRARLEREGLFDPARKRPLPRFPRRVGVVTSPNGAVFHDVVNVLSRRFPAVEIVLAPTPVQGEDAAPLIAFGLEALNHLAEPDVILVVRGGGSLEDLWSFNEEVVARAIHGSRAPVVSGVGHETDLTIADLVADLRAPTPSAAAELVVPDWRECVARGQALAERLRDLARARLGEGRGDLADLALRLRRHEPRGQIDDRRLATDGLAERALTALRHRLALERARLAGRADQLEALSPEAVLRRGYSVTRQARTGAVVRRLEEIYPGAPLEVRVAGGRFRATVDRSVWAQQSFPMEGVESGASRT
ncbi:MAG TPA: exodeoxyribonuclease VII large subunit [Chloroflexota bacterium]